MVETKVFEAGHYRYVRGPFQYSGGVAAQPGYTIERVRFSQRPNMVEGFQAIEAYLTARGHPFTSFCACELRSPAPFTEKGFIDFNRVYVGTLERWGIFKNDENPVARSNVCLEIGGPSEPSFEASELSSEASQPSPDAPEPNSDASNPSSDVSKPSPDASEPNFAASVLSSKASEPSSEASKPSCDASEPMHQN